MVCSVRRIFILLLISVCFFTSMYFYYSYNNTNCDEQIHVFRLVCKSFNDSTRDFSLRQVGKHVAAHLRNTYHKVKNLLPSTDDEDDKDIDALIEKYSKKLSELLKKKNDSIHVKEKMNLPKPTSVRPPSTKEPVVEWIDLTEGKKYSDYGDNTCGDNSHRKTLTRIFRKWTEISTKLNISYFLTCGTLLGAWRNGDVIPYDTDMDVLIDRRDAIKLEKIKNARNFSPHDGKLRLVLQEDWRLPYDDRRRFSCDGRLVPAYEGECSFQEPLGRVIKDGLHLDIYDYKSVNGILDDPSEGGQKFNVNDVLPLKKCRFLGQVTYCPKNPTAVLFQFYGNNINNLAPNTICKKGDWTKKNRRK